MPTITSIAAKVCTMAKMEKVLDVPTCSPMYKNAIELAELRHLRSIKSTPIVEARIKKIEDSFSSTQLKKMDLIIAEVNNLD